MAICLPLYIHIHENTKKYQFTWTAEVTSSKIKVDPPSSATLYRVCLLQRQTPPITHALWREMQTVLSLSLGAAVLLF